VKIPRKTRQIQRHQHRDPHEAARRGQRSRNDNSGGACADVALAEAIGCDARASAGWAPDPVPGGC